VIALDTNILVHAHRGDASLHSEAKTCVRQLAEAEAPWFICYHSLIEFYGIATHPKVWSVASTPLQAADQISAWRESPSLRVLTERPQDIDGVMVIAAASKVVGPMIHDARIASCCLTHGIRELWTVDRDFSRFPQLQTRNPLV
jgi:toxin-antitoxin system PIN domain toxin